MNLDTWDYILSRQSERRLEKNFQTQGILEERIYWEQRAEVVRGTAKTRGWLPHRPGRADFSWELVANFYFIFFLVLLTFFFFFLVANFYSFKTKKKFLLQGQHWMIS